jgi:hypothetical protein
MRIEMIKITEITPTDNHTIIVKLDNGKSGVLDVKEYLNLGVFSELKDIEYFRQVRNHGRYISWPNEQDLCADSIAASLT